METATPKTFCPLPWTHLFVSNIGKIHPCCHSQRVEAESFASLRSSKDVGNTELLKKTRLEMLKGIWPAECGSCELAEWQGRDSPRKYALNDYAEVIEDCITRTESDGTFQSKFLSYDLRLGNNCNLQCRMCSPTSSKKLIPEWEASSHPFEREEARIAKKINWDSIDSIWKTFLEGADNVRRIYLAGGEPTLIPKHLEFLEGLIQKNLSKNIEIIYSSNITVLLPRLEYFLEHFKKIQFSLSIDGSPQVNEYIRFPTKTATIEKNLKALDEIGVRHTNLRLVINTTVQAYNVSNLTDLLVYLRGFQFKKIEWVPEFSKLMEPRYLRIETIPLKIRFKALTDLMQFKEEFSGELNEPEKARFQNLIKMFLGSNEEKNEGEFYYFVKTTRFFDQKRNQSLLTVMPALKPEWDAVQSIQNSKIGLKIKKKIIYLVFFFTIIMSHIILPVSKTHNIFPFFDWQLFNSIPQEKSYDAVLEVSGQKVWYSDLFLGTYSSRLFHVLQIVGHKKCQIPSDLNMLKSGLKQKNALLLEIRQMKLPDRDYVKISSDDKWKNTETVCVPE